MAMTHSLLCGTKTAKHQNMCLRCDKTLTCSGELTLAWFLGTPDHYVKSLHDKHMDSVHSNMSICQTPSIATCLYVKQGCEMPV